MDFTLNIYQLFIQKLISKGYNFQTFEQYLRNSLVKDIILRHDVDKLPYNSLSTAKIESELGVRGSYYFRIGKESNNPEVIKQIAELGHEIGYHYETMDTASERLKGKGKRLKEEEKGRLVDAAYEEFCKNLEYFKTLYPIKTICMHGSPLSKYDNKDIWKKYDYKSLGLVGEPYFDIDFNKFFYLTDTGRCWNGYKYSVRDKMPQQEQWIKQGLVFKTTNDIIRAAEHNKLPNQIMITVHPQRWNDSVIPWTKELVMQNVKNMVKRGLIKMKTEQGEFGEFK